MALSEEQALPLPDLKGIRRSCSTWHGRAGAWLVKLALDRDAAWLIVLSLIAIHVIAWTIILTVAKRDEGPNSDSLEAYGWSRLLLWGYGKHPPMTGWLARIWFEVFPTSDWALYALAVTLLGCAALACWLLAIRVVDRRRAFVVTAALLIYPVFNFRGARFNPDLLQVPLFILVVLAFLVAFETRSLASALVLGLVCACAVLTKYWALLVVGAVGLSALLHPDRCAFFRSSTPYVTAAVFIMTIAPHLIWLVQSDFASFEYASGYFVPRGESLAQAGKALAENAALLFPLAVALVWAVTPCRLRPVKNSRTVDPCASRHIRVIVLALILVPPALAVGLRVFMKGDWGFPLYTLVPLAVIAHPRLGVGQRAIGRITALWAGLTLVALAAAPVVPSVKAEPDNIWKATVDLAPAITRLWHQRFDIPLPAVAGPKSIAAGISFYSPDHPILFTSLSRRIATWIDEDGLKRSGFVAICVPEWLTCLDQLRAISPSAEEVALDALMENPATSEARGWSVYFVAPQQR